MEPIELRPLSIDAQIAKINEIIASGSLITSVMREVPWAIDAHPMSGHAEVKLLDPRGGDAELICSLGAPAELCMTELRRR